MKKATIVSAALAVLAAICAAGGAGAGGDVPKVLTLGSLSRLYEPVPFNHSGHVSMAGGCADCHHQHGSTQVQACLECHRIVPSQFKKSVHPAALRPCRECHAASARPGEIGKPALQAAYHRACFKCHRGEVGDVGKDPKACAEMCHLSKAQAMLERKK